MIMFADRFVKDVYDTFSIHIFSIWLTVHYDIFPDL